MKLRTEIEIEPVPEHFKINHQSRIQLYGSCFVENMGARLEKNLYNTEVNPFGVLYNPRSIARSIKWLMNDAATLDEAFICHDGSLFYSLLHHSRFSKPSKEELKEDILQSKSRSVDFLRTADFLIVTFGSSFVYEHKEKGFVVSNCHKLPSKQFDKYRLAPEEIVGEWNELISMLGTINRSLRIIFTVSPIRHLNDGAHANQLNKAVLLLAVESLCQQHPQCRYFPAYELLLDDLRDYRFYADNLCHPSPLAIDYIWEKFSLAHITEKSRKTASQWAKIEARILHRPTNVKSLAYLRFLHETRALIEQFAAEHPYTNMSTFQKEIADRLTLIG